MRDAAKLPAMPRAAPKTWNYLAPDVSRTKVEKLWAKGIREGRLATSSDSDSGAAGDRLEAEKHEHCIQGAKCVIPGNRSRGST